MAFSKQNAFLIILFFAPVVCCFVGIGVFVHVILAAEEAEQQKQIALRQQEKENFAELQQRLDNLLKEKNNLEEKIAAITEKIRELTQKLLQADKDSETAEKIEEEIRDQKKRLALLLAKLAGLDDEIARKKKEIEELEAQIKNIQSLEDRQKKLLSEKNKLEERVKQAAEKHNQLCAKADQLRRKREEQGREAPIIPRKPLPTNMPKPLFVECTAAGAVVQPEGSAFNLSPNAGDRSRFLSAADRSGYVVFLIRPGGFSVFNTYCDLVKQSGNVKFGFEPVDASWKLIYPN